VGCDDHGSAATVRVLHQDVDAVAVKGLPAQLGHGQHLGGAGLAAGGLAEELRMPHDVLAHGLEVRHDLGRIGVLLLGLLDELRHRRGGHLAVQGLQLRLGVLLDLAEAPDGRRHIGRHGLVAALEFLAGGLVHVLQGIGIQGLAPEYGNRHQPARRLGQAEAPRLDALLQPFQLLALLLLRRLDDALLLLLVGLGLERPGDAGLQVADEPLAVLAEGARPPRLQANGAGLVRVGEVVHVAPVGRRGQLGRLARQEAADGRGLAGPGRPQGEQIESRAADAHAEGDGLDRSVLGDDLFQGLEGLGALEGQGIRGADLAERVGEQRCGHERYLPLLPLYRGSRRRARGPGADGPSPLVRQGGMC